MGQRGPIPKRAEDRHGHRAKAEQDALTTVTVDGEVVKPDPDPDWHPLARQLWDSLADSGQARFYEPTDWAVAYSLMDDLSHYKHQGRRSAQMLQTIMSGLSLLLVTEADRRRVSIELDRGAEGVDDDRVAVMDKWRRRMQ